MGGSTQLRLLHLLGKGSRENPRTWTVSYVEGFLVGDQPQSRPRVLKLREHEAGSERWMN